MPNSGIENHLGEGGGLEGRKPGYTVLAIKALTPYKPSIDLREERKVYQVWEIPPPDAVEEDRLKNNLRRTQKEAKVISSTFIPHIWRRIQEWVRRNPETLSALSEEFSFSAELSGELPIEEIKERVKASTSSLAVKLLGANVSSILLLKTREWLHEQGLKQREDMPTDPEERKRFMNYARYKKLNEILAPHIQPEMVVAQNEQNTSGFNTGSHIDWQCLAVLPEVYKLQYGTEPTKADLANLIEGTRPILIAMAESGVSSLNAIELGLGNLEITIPQLTAIFLEKDSGSKIRSLLGQEFDPKNFWISKKNEKLYLEIKPEVMDKVKRISYFFASDDDRMGCAALPAEGIDGKSVLVEMYDWFSRLYTKYYINEHPEYE